MLFEPVVLEENAVIPESSVQVGFRFDWEKNEFVMENGTPAEVTEEEAIKEWFNLIFRTPQRRYAIYPTRFGARAQDLVGLKLAGTPKGFYLSELRRQAQETVGYLPAVTRISTMNLEKDGSITGSITLDSGEEAKLEEVLLYEP